jgi:hypothetical protein
MSVWRQLHPLFVLAPIVVLLLVGLVVAVRSGLTAHSRRERLGTAALNLVSVVLRVVGYGTALFVVQRMIGAPAAVGW